MVTTIKINDKDVEITLTLEQVEAITRASRPKIELEGGEWFIRTSGNIRRGPSDSECRNFGIEFKTKELAEQASKDMRRGNRLRALARQIDPSWIDKGIGNNAWVILESANGYSMSNRVYARIEGIIYMSKDTAKTICDYLNKGLFDLDGEE